MTAKPVSRQALPRLLSLRAVSDATTIPRSTLYTLVARGELPAVRLTESSLRIREDDLIAFIDSRREVAQP